MGEPGSDLNNRKWLRWDVKSTSGQVSPLFMDVFLVNYRRMSEEISESNFSRWEKLDGPGEASFCYSSLNQGE